MKKEIRHDSPWVRYAVYGAICCMVGAAIWFLYRFFNLIN